MKNEFPKININDKFIKLKSTQNSKIEETKKDKKISTRNLNQRHYNKFNITDFFDFKTNNKNTNLKPISLTSLINRNPKRLSMSEFIYPQNSAKKLSYFSSKSTNEHIMRSSSNKIVRTNSILARLNPGYFDEIKKFEYYNKIENTKSYQDFLEKEREVKPNESIINHFLEEKKKNKLIIKSLQRPRISIYESLYLFNPKNMIKLRDKFNKKEQFENYILTKFVENKRNHLINKKKLNPNKRNIYIILDGDIIFNENYIKGFFIQIPFLPELNKINQEQKKNIINNILKQGQNFFKTKKPLINIFSPEKQYISNIYEIKNNFEYLFVSPNTICLGANILTTRPLMKIYDTDFSNQFKKEEKKEKKFGVNLFKSRFNRIKDITKIFKIKEIKYGIRSKYEKYKPHYSFAEGENYIENVDYVNYSDDEERKKSREKNILKNCCLKNDFFLYINDKDTKTRINNLKKKLKFTETYNLKSNYKKYETNFEKLLEKYKKEIYHQLKINPKIFKVDPIDSKIHSHNLEFPDDQLNNLYTSRHQKRKAFDRIHEKYLKRKPKKKYVDEFTIKKNSYDPFYHNLQRNVVKYYNPLILYNIPKLLTELKNFTRKQIFELYGRYKDLITMSYSKYKNKFILENGVDFETFWRCTDNLSSEKMKFANKIFNQINRREICFLSMEDFLTGMYYMKNSDLSKKLDLFLGMLDKSGKGSINFNEAVDICKESIQRSFGENEENDDNTRDQTALNQMSEFFAGFVFQLIGVDKKNNLKIEDLRKAAITKESELNEFEYLEMFCGANI